MRVGSQNQLCGKSRGDGDHMLELLFYIDKAEGREGSEGQEKYRKYRGKRCLALRYRRQTFIFINSEHPIHKIKASIEIVNGLPLTDST